jgi:isocitrate dehydrogenase
MGEGTSGEHRRIEERIVGLYNVLYEDDLAREEIEFYAVEEEDCEAEIYLPDIGVNVEQWRGWSTEKRVEVLVHEFAHAENYADDHAPAFWDRVVERTEVAVARRDAVEDVFDAALDPDALRRTVVESVHEQVIETDIDSVEARREAVGGALGVPAEPAAAD